MPICPECKAEIDRLNAFAKEESKYEVYLEKFVGVPGGPFKDDSYSLGYDYQQAVSGSVTGTDFMCPECEQSIYLIEDEDTQPELVIRFLKGEVFPCNSLCIHYVKKECITEVLPLCDKPDDYKEVGDVIDNLMNQRDDDVTPEEAA